MSQSTNILSLPFLSKETADCLFGFPLLFTPVLLASLHPASLSSLSHRLEILSSINLARLLFLRLVARLANDLPCPMFFHPAVDIL